MSKFSLSGAKDVATQQERGTPVVMRDHLGDAFTFTNEAGVEVECTAMVAGQFSNAYRRAEEAQRDRHLKRRSLQLTGELLARQQIELVAACVLEWTLYGDGKLIPCTKENVITVLTAAPWMRADIEAAMGDPARFLG